MRLDYQILLTSPPLNLLAGSAPGVTTFMRGTVVITFHKTQLLKDDKRRKQIRPGLPFISLRRLPQRLGLFQTKQRDYHNPADAYYSNPLFAVQTIGLHFNKRSGLQYFWGQTASANSLYSPLVLNGNCNSIFQWTILTFKLHARFNFVAFFDLNSRFWCTVVKEYSSVLQYWV